MGQFEISGAGTTLPSVMAKKKPAKGKRPRKTNSRLLSKVKEAQARFRQTEAVCERKGKAIGISREEYAVGVMTGKYPKIQPGELDR